MRIVLFGHVATCVHVVVAVVTHAVGASSVASIASVARAVSTASLESLTVALAFLTVLGSHDMVLTLRHKQTLKKTSCLLLLYLHFFETSLYQLSPSLSFLKFIIYWLNKYLFRHVVK